MIRNLAKCLCLAMTALAAIWAYADAVSTARLGSLHPKNGVVVTNVDFTTSNTQLVDTIEATAPTPTWDTLSGKPTFATVATSGAYSDLTGKPNFDAIPTNLVKTVISNSLYNLTYDETLQVTWRKTAEGGAFYERCYTNINMIGVSK